MKKIAPVLPLLGVIAFIIAYFYATSIYPGGTKFDHSAPGYDHLLNFWCDLLMPVAYSGEPNPGYTIALIATMGLTASLLFFWYFITLLFLDQKLKVIIVRITGCLSMFLTMFVFSSIHDALVLLASFFGFIAFGIVLTEFLKKKEILLFATTLITVACALVAVLLWQVNLLPLWTPISEKIAFISFFMWVWLIVIRYIRVL